jgi:Pectate lyase superfamily protein/Secretion system C-terminal sorting domain
MKTILTSYFIFILFINGFAQQTIYPSDINWNNAKTRFGCKGDGITDDTDSLRKAARTYTNQYHTNIVVFLPKGTYIISDSIKFLSTYYDKDVVFLGEHPDSTIIKLKDNAAGFQDVANPRPMIQTRNGNQAFGNYFKNLTINTGNNNAGAVGLDYITSNYGTVENVKIISPDNSGYCGLQMERVWAGPGFIKNVFIKGYQYGIRVTQCEYSMTFEDVTLQNQSVCAVYNECNTLAMRKIISNNTVKALENRGRIILLDSKLDGGNTSTNAIDNINGFFFGRNITTTGYANAFSNNGTAILGNNITEYHTDNDNSLFPNNGKSLNLPIEETPKYVNNNLSEWAKANSYGAQAANPFYSTFDAGPGVQAAFASGKKVIYFDKVGDNGSGYGIYNNIVIPPSVQMITGFHEAGFQFFNNSRFVVNDSAAPLFIDAMGGVRILNNSKRTVVFKSASLKDYDNTINNKNGKVFLQDEVTYFKPTFPVRMWARHLNSEVQPEGDTNVYNNGGRHWILGYKTEGRATLAITVDSGRTEILGSLVYPASGFAAGNTLPAFIVKDACFSVTGLTRTSYAGNGWYGISVKETQGPATQNFLTSASANFYTMPFYSSSKINCCLPAIAVISGANNVVTGVVINYGVTIGVSGTIYDWSVQGGTIQSGQGTNQISVLWNIIGVGKVSINQSQNNCGETFQLLVNITGAVLPLNMGNLTMQCNNRAASFLWNVYSEENIQQYNLQASNDGSLWENIANANSTNIVPKQYKIDIPKNDFKFYRLAVVNNNTSIEKYSNIISNQCVGKNENVVVYPTPFSDKIFVQVKNATNYYSATLTDAVGKMIVQKIFKLQLNETQFINTNHLSSGIYFLKITDNNNGLILVKKVIK